MRSNISHDRGAASFNASRRSCRSKMPMSQKIHYVTSSNGSKNLPSDLLTCWIVRLTDARRLCRIHFLVLSPELFVSTHCDIMYLEASILNVLSLYYFLFVGDQLFSPSAMNSKVYFPYYNPRRTRHLGPAADGHYHNRTAESDKQNSSSSSTIGRMCGFAFQFHILP